MVATSKSYLTKKRLSNHQSKNLLSHSRSFPNLRFQRRQSKINGQVQQSNKRKNPPLSLNLKPQYLIRMNQIHFIAVLGEELERILIGILGMLQRLMILTMSLATIKMMKKRIIMKKVILLERGKRLLMFNRDYPPLRLSSNRRELINLPILLNK